MCFSRLWIVAVHFTVAVETDNFSVDFYAAMVAERGNLYENKTKTTVGCFADLVHGAVHCADYGVCGRS